MEENNFWIKLWSIAATFILAIAIVLVVNTQATRAKISASPDPIATACAMDLTSERSSILCIDYIKNRK